MKKRRMHQGNIKVVANIAQKQSISLSDITDLVLVTNNTITSWVVHFTCIKCMGIENRDNGHVYWAFRHFCTECTQTLYFKTLHWYCVYLTDVINYHHTKSYRKINLIDIRVIFELNEKIIQLSLDCYFWYFLSTDLSSDQCYLTTLSDCCYTPKWAIL
jgi:hypothetical protein